MSDVAAIRRLGYVRPLDGVRALAVLAVMGTHTDLMGFAGGIAGVDIFFVLSGFLITTLLLEEHSDHGRLFLGRFYGRRALRLFPALFAMLAVVTLYALLVADPDQQSDLLKEVLAAGTYTTNFAWIHGVEDVFLGHTWSLALEEQFYLVWPLIVIVCLKVRGELALLLTTVFFVCMIVALRLWTEISVWGLFSLRPDAILIGCIAALLRRRYRSASSLASSAPLLLASCVVLLVAVVTRGWLGRTDGLGTVTVAVAAAILTLGLVDQPTSLLGRAMSLRPMQEIGRRSYGLYIWHLPIFRYIAGEDLGLPDPLIVGMKYGLTFLVAWLSFALVETPALRLKNRLRAPSGRRLGSEEVSVASTA